MKGNHDVILDCYSDEPSGFGVPPYLGVHQRYVSGALDFLGRKHFYVTIDDLRYAKNQKFDVTFGHTDISIKNLTKNAENAASLLDQADTIFIIMGCFVDYEYVSALPPRAHEVFNLVNEFKAKKVLFYVLGAQEVLPPNFKKSKLFQIVDVVVTGHSYNYLLKGKKDSFTPNYSLLAEITKNIPSVIKQIYLPMIIEVETMTGCNRRPGCSFCIENLRALPVEYRQENDIIAEVQILYKEGARHIRLGRQPNFYYYMRQNVSSIEKVLSEIRNKCPNLEMFHIDNVNPESVVTNEGKEITKLIVKHCTSGNIAPFGVESFDPLVREKNNLNGTLEEIMEAIAILNEYGQEKGEDGMPKFLPGVNLIFNLNGQRENTLDYNLMYLDKIMAKGYQTQRLFFRKLTSPLGVSIDEYAKNANDELFEKWRDQIYVNYAYPMLERVFPAGHIIRNLRVEVWQKGNSLLRQLATCPTRVVIENKLLSLNSYCDVEVQGLLKHRTLKGLCLT